MEIERKFLVKSSQYRAFAQPKLIIQGYLSLNPNCIIRVRIIQTLPFRIDEKAFITIKSKTVSISRQEFEYEIPLDDANQMLTTMCVKHIKKNRYTIKLNDHIWEVDEFLGKHTGLVIAEIELTNENEIFLKPDWIGEEVSQDSRYYNTNLEDDNEYSKRT